jgi:hypothetical protein
VPPANASSDEIYAYATNTAAGDGAVSRRLFAFDIDIKFKRDFTGIGKMDAGAIIANAVDEAFGPARYLQHCFPDSIQARPLPFPPNF